MALLRIAPVVCSSSSSSSFFFATFQRLSSAGETSKSVATVLPLRFKNLPYRLGAEPRVASKRLLLFLLLFLLLLLPAQPRRWKKKFPGK